MKRFWIPGELYRRLSEEASKTPAAEICGLIGGRRESGMSLYPVMNVSPNPERAFFMQPQAQIAAMKVMRERGEELAGIYHSHPATAARPSVEDRQQAAYPGVAYLIISLADTGQPEIAGFVYDGEDFAEIALEVGATG